MNERGEDINLAMKLTFEEALFGVEKTITVSKVETCDACSGTGAKNGTAFSTCPDCKGVGRVRIQQNTMFGTTIREGACPKCGGTGKVIKEKCDKCAGKGYKRVQKEITVKIPAGIDDGQTVRMRGEGNSPLGRGTNGDLNIKITVAKHKLFKRDGVDLSYDLYLPFTTLLLGGKVEIPLPKGKFVLDIKERTPSGTIMRLKGKGVKILNREAYGDLLVTLKSEAPKNLSVQQKDLLEKLSESFSDIDFPKYRDFKKNNL